MMNRFVREGTQKGTRPDAKNMSDHQSRTETVLTAVLHDSSTQNGRGFGMRGSFLFGEAMD